MVMSEEGFPNTIKNEAIVSNLFGCKHNDTIDRIMHDDKLTQRKKEDMLFEMLDDIDLEIEENSIDYYENQDDNNNQNNYVYQLEIKKEDHQAALICGRIISKILVSTERCSTVVLKLIDVFLSKNSQLIVDNLVYRFINNRIRKDYKLHKVKELIRQSNPRQRLIDDVKEMHYLTEDSLQVYLNDSANIVHNSMSLYPINHDALIEAMDSPVKKKLMKREYKKYEGRLDQTPTNEFFRNFGCMGNKYTQILHSMKNYYAEKNKIPFDDSESNSSYDSSNETENTSASLFKYDENEFKLGRVTHSISIIDSKLFEENDKEYEYNPEIHPLDQGLLFKLLFKKFNNIVLIKSKDQNRMEDNLLMTSIYAKLCSIPLCDSIIETYYLHALMFCELKNDCASLIRSIVSISNQIRDKSDFEDYEYLKAIVKVRLENPSKAVKLQKTFNKNIDELKEMMKEYLPLIEGSIIFEEFLKEYLTIFDSKNELIKLMNIYMKVNGMKIKF